MIFTENYKWHIHQFNQAHTDPREEAPTNKVIFFFLIKLNWTKGLSVLLLQQVGLVTKELENI